MKTKLTSKPTLQQTPRLRVPDSAPARDLTISLSQLPSIPRSGLLPISAGATDTPPE